MHVHDAQRELRDVYLRGGPGQVVSGTIWLISAALATWSTHRSAMWFLVFGGMFIFPLTQLVLRMIGRRATLSKDNPLGGLAMQIAFTVPLSLPLIGAATLYREGWFYPAFLVVVGAHYLPFVFLYGMKAFGVLAALLLAAGLVIGTQAASSFTLGGWVGGASLVVFGVAGWVIWRNRPD